MPVTFQFVTSGEPQDRLIQYFSHGWPSHVDMVWPANMPGGEERLFGARLDGGVAVRGLHYKKFGKIARVTLPSTPEQDDRIKAFAIEQMGKPYNWVDIVHFPFGIRRDWRDQDSWFCSELAECLVEHAGIWRPIATPANCVTPSDFLNLCSAVAELIYVQ